MNGKHDKGFTLLELLVAMMLLSTVTLVAAIALKIAIETWERGAVEGGNIQVYAAIPALMEKQLESLVRNDPFDEKSPRLLPFCGEKHGLSFFTCYAPQGSPWQGLLRVTYLFDNEKKTLYLFEKVITRKEDLSEKFDPLSMKWDNSLKPAGQVPGIAGFDVAYMDRRDGDIAAGDGLKEVWKRSSNALPIGLGVSLSIESGPKAEFRKWYYYLDEI